MFSGSGESINADPLFVLPTKLTWNCCPIPLEVVMMMMRRIILMILIMMMMLVVMTQSQLPSYEYVPLQRSWVSKNKSREKVFEFWLSKVTFHICQMGEKHFRWVSPFPLWDVANPVTKSNFSMFFFTFSLFLHILMGSHICMICDGNMHYALHHFLLKKRAWTSLQSWYFRCCCIFCLRYAWQ